MLKKILLLLAVALCAVVTHASAQILVAFDVTGSGGTSQGPGVPTETTDASVTATNLARTTVTFATLNNSFNSVNWNLTSTVVLTTNYISFDVTAGTAPVTLSTLQYSIDGTSTAPSQGMWAYTLDGGTTFTQQTAFALSSTAPTALATWDFTDFSLPTGQTAEFRFYSFGATSISGGTPSATTGAVRVLNISGNDLVLNGPAAVPEPSSYAALALGLMALLAVNRLRRNASSAS